MHSGSILAMAVESNSGHVFTVGQDRALRAWTLGSSGIELVAEKADAHRDSLEGLSRTATAIIAVCGRLDDCEKHK